MNEEVSAVKRREEIVTLLNNQEEISVKELKEKYHVSDMTIRRDLHVLEEQGIIELFYGGARRRKTRYRYTHFDEREGELFEYKKKIALKGAELLKEGDQVYIDTSTTLTLMLRYLPPIHLSVVTNSLSAVLELVNNPQIELHIAPGIYDSQYGGSADYSTIEYLSQFHYDASFFGTAAIDPRFGVSASKEIEQVIKKTVMRNSDSNYLLADHTKYGKKNRMKYADIKDYDAILTNDELDADIRELLKKNNGKLKICD